MDKLTNIDRVEISMNDLRKLIQESIETGESFSKSRNNNPRYKDTERLLYSYPSLILNVAEDEESLKNNSYVAKSKSKDILKFMGAKSPLGIGVEIEQERMKSIERTKTQITRIENALEKIKNIPDFCIIEMKYFGTCQEGIWDGNPIEIFEIAKRTCMSESTVKRRRRELIDRLSVILFGAEAVNI